MQLDNRAVALEFVTGQRHLVDLVRSVGDPKHAGLLVHLIASESKGTNIVGNLNFPPAGPIITDTGAPETVLARPSGSRITLKLGHMEVTRPNLLTNVREFFTGIQAKNALCR